MKQSADTTGSTRDFLAVATLFAGNGLMVRTLGGTLPGQQARLDLGRDERRAVTAVACLDTPTATAVAGLLHRARQARPLRTTTPRS